MQSNHSRLTTGLLVVIVILLVIGIWLLARKPAVPGVAPQTGASATVATASSSSASSTAQNPAPASGQITVAGMQQYTDSSFGFSFWYPDTWQVTIPVNPPFGAEIAGATVVKKLALEPIGQTSPEILIQEVHSTDRTITDTGGAGPIGPITYFFDPTTHLWMTTNSESGSPTTPVAANISTNTMGGLHMFGGTSRFDTTIVPLSADNFVVLGDGDGTPMTRLLTATIVALDPAVATPVDASQQIETIQAEETASAGQQQ